MNFGGPPGAGGGGTGQPMMPFPGGGPAPMHVSQMTPLQQQQMRAAQHQQRMQQQQMMMNQMTPQQHAMMQQQQNAMYAQGQMPYGRYDNWRPGMPPPTNAKEVTSAENRKRMMQANSAAYMHTEMQKRSAAAAQNQMMMGAGGMRPMGYPPGAGTHMAPGSVAHSQMAMMNQRMGMAGMSVPSSAGQMTVGGMLSQQQQHQVGMSQHPQMNPQMPPVSGHPGGPSQVTTTSMMNMTHQSPQLAQQMQPATPQGGPASIPAPGSNQGPGSNQPASSEQSEEYAACLKEMKDEYLEKMKRINERYTIDQIQKPKGLNQLLEILEEKRTVSVKILKSLTSSCRILLARECLTFPLLDEMRRSILDREEHHRRMNEGYDDSKDETNRSKENEAEIEEPDEKHLADPWKAVRHLTIKVPNHVRTLLEQCETPMPSSSALATSSDGIASERRKRKISSADGEVDNEIGGSTKAEVEEKRLREAGYVADTTRVRITEQTMRVLVPDPRATGIYDSRFQVECVFDPRQPWQMPLVAREELSRVVWSLDTTCLPTSSHAPYVVVCIESQVMMCSPLHIAIPLQYPMEPAVVQFESSFPESSHIASQLEKLFEKYVGLRASARTIADFCEAFESACHEFVCQRSHNPAGTSVAVLSGGPSAGAQEYHVASKGTKIAQKGMVA